MPKNEKHHNESSSDDSDVSLHHKCEEKNKCDDKCKEKKCEVNKCEDLGAEKIHCLYNNAVVQIHSEFILLGGTATEGGLIPLEGATGGTPLGEGTRADVILEGNGFFIKGHYIVAPAQLVLAPPSITSVANRFPFLNPDDIALGQVRDQLVRASRILVSVFNVNNEGNSFVYEADLVGVDGAGDIAVLRINFKRQWNSCNPFIKECHPVLKFGESRAAKEGEKVYLLGDYVSDANDRRRFNAVGGIADGLLSDHRYLEYSGWALPELVLVSAPAYAFSAGLPILDGQGNVLGMQTTDLAAVAVASEEIEYESREGLGLVAGPSEFFMRRVIKTIIRGSCSRRHNHQLEVVCDPAGTYYRYKKGYAGIAYDVFTGVMYDYTTDYTNGTIEAGLPRIRLGPNGEFFNVPSCKELIGIRVLGLAGLNPEDGNVLNGLNYVPGGTATAPLAASLPTSAFLNKLLPGDQITHINGIPIGDLGKQITPSLITWRLAAGDQLEVAYRRGGNAANTADNAFTENYENYFIHNACLADFPALMDYPWYAVNIFPLLVERGFNFDTQLGFPQLPQLADGAAFHPAF